LALEQGLAHHHSGRLDEAEKLYRRVLDADPSHADALHLLGVAALQTGRAEEAAGFIRQALESNPDNADALNNLGQAYESLGQRGEAIEAYQKAIKGVPGFAAAIANLAGALLEEDKPEDAVVFFAQACEASPDDPDILCGYAKALASLGRLQQSVSCLRCARDISPDNPDILVNLGAALQADGKTDEAIASFEAAIAINPEFVEAHYNLGLALQERGRLEGAVLSYGRALKIDPIHIMSHVNLGGALMSLGRIDAAIASQRRAIAIDPDHGEAHHSLGLVLLLQGNLEQGWAEYQWRWKTRKHGELRQFPQPSWQGQPLDAKTVLVWAEQGVGDEIMFAGMIADLQARGASVVVQSDPRLLPVFERSLAGVTCIAKKTPPGNEGLSERIDFQTPGGNLGRWLRASPEAFPDRRSYLAADPEKRERLRAQYQGHARGDAGGILVGMAWSSKNKEMGLDKSVGLMDMAPLTRISGVTLVDLQYGDTGGERKAFEKITGCSIIHDDAIDQMKDLDAFAAQVAAMDLIISVSNTTVHMAGALGVPTWVMLNAVPLKFWMLERSDSPWYPSVRLFRQQTPGHWGDVIERVSGELGAWAEKSTRGEER